MRRKEKPCEGATRFEKDEQQRGKSLFASTARNPNQCLSFFLHNLSSSDVQADTRLKTSRIKIPPVEKFMDLKILEEADSENSERQIREDKGEKNKSETRLKDHGKKK